MPLERGEVSEPKDLFRGSAYDFANAVESAIGVRNDKDTEAGLTEDTFVIAGSRELKIILAFFFPDLEVLMSQVDFDEGSYDA